MENNIFNNISDDQLWAILDRLVDNNNEDNNEDNNVIKKKNYNLLISNDICNICNSTNIIYSNNKYICTICGEEINEILDDSPEWNNFDDTKDSGRCGAPTSVFFPKSSLGTTINIQGYSKLKMLRTWGQIPYKERSLAEVFNDIDSKGKKFKITKAIIDNTKIYYKMLRDIKNDENDKPIIIRGENRKQIIAACFFFGALKQNSPRSDEEVAEIFNLDIKDVTKGNRNFWNRIKDKIILFDIIPFNKGSAFIERFCCKIKLSKDIVNLAKKIADNAYKLDIASDHQQKSISSACILLASKISENPINKTELKELFDISEVTIIRTYKELNHKDLIKILINDEITNKILVIKDMRNKNNVLIDESDESDVKNKEEKKKIECNKINKNINSDTINNIDTEIIQKKKCGRPKKNIILQII